MRIRLVRRARACRCLLQTDNSTVVGWPPWTTSTTDGMPEQSLSTVSGSTVRRGVPRSRRHCAARRCCCRGWPRRFRCRSLEPVVVSQAPLRVRHRLISGVPCPGVDAEQGEAVGRFVRALHDVPVSSARRLGVPDWQPIALPRFHQDVLPMIAAVERALAEPATQLLERCARAPKGALVHSDLGPDHIRVDGGVVSGIIDWTDACIGDPALDLAWVVFGTQPAVRRSGQGGVRSEPGPRAQGTGLASARTVVRGHLRSRPRRPRLRPQRHGRRHQSAALGELARLVRLQCT